MSIPKQFAAPALILAVLIFGAAFRMPKPVQQQEQHSSDLQRFFLENGVSIDLGPNWKPSGAGNAAPPGGLGPYAPPFHFNQILFLTNEHQYTLLQLATSDNPLVGHDAYWLDTQMHATNGTGTSLPDYLFFLFLPPSHSCMDDVLAKLAAASRPAEPDPSGAEFSKSEFQVTYSCSYCAYALGLLLAATHDRYNFPAGAQRPSRLWRFQKSRNAADGAGGFRGDDVLRVRGSLTRADQRKRGPLLQFADGNPGLARRFLLGDGHARPISICCRPQPRRNTPSFTRLRGAGPNSRTDFLRILERVRTD